MAEHAFPAGESGLVRSRAVKNFVLAYLLVNIFKRQSRSQLR
jgi:hypothetical protein